MNSKRNIFTFIATCLVVFTQPMAVFADKCDDVAGQANKLYNDARNAAKQTEYTKAIKLYQEAEQHYMTAADMENCRRSEIKTTSTSSVNLCKENIAALQEYVQKSQEADTYNQAAAKFNEGNSYAQKKQWKLAVHSFKEAKRIWQSLAQTNSEKSKEAQQSAEKAGKLANQARQHM